MIAVGSANFIVLLDIKDSVLNRIHLVENPIIQLSIEHTMTINSIVWSHYINMGDFGFFLFYYPRPVLAFQRRSCSDYDTNY